MIRRLLFPCLLIPVLILSACQSDSSTPTATPTATENPSRRPPTATPGPTNTPTVPPIFTPDYNSETPQPIDNFVMPGSWHNGDFDEPSGVRHRLIDFEQRGLVLHLLTTNCEHCLEQHQILLQASGTLLDAGLLSDTVIVALGTNPLEPASLIESTLQTVLGEDYAIASTIRDDPKANYLVGAISRELQRDLEEAFGEEIFVQENNVILVIEPNGLAHVMTDISPIPQRAFLSALAFYGNAPNDPDAAP